jgi:integrase
MNEMRTKKMKQIKCKEIKVVEPIRSKNDLKRIYDWFMSHQKRPYAVLFTLGINSGLRVSDLLGFDVGDVYHKEELVLREQKTGKYKKFPLKKEVQDLLNDFCKNRDHNEPLFVGRCGARLDRSQVYRFICMACDDLNIAANVGTHTMRKTFGYHHYKQFKDIALLQTIFNHSSPDVTKRYIGITQDEMNESYLNLNFEASAEDLKNVKIKLTGRTRIKRILSYVRNYIKNGGTRHLEFAKDILDVAGVNAA